jgi:hypothetical protein
MTTTFKGVINLDIRKSKPDWDGFLAKKAPEGAPNVLVILYDDTGCACWSSYGGRVAMPTLDRLAKSGLIYSQWHTTSVCSPTRSCFLTGRNHHQNGFGTIAESACGFPGYNGHIPKENATLATVLRDAGWSTFWIGKNHNVPVDAVPILWRTGHQGYLRRGKRRLCRRRTGARRGHGARMKSVATRSKLPHLVEGILHITQRERPELQARPIFSVAHAYLEAHSVL